MHLTCPLAVRHAPVVSANRSWFAQTNLRTNLWVIGLGWSLTGLAGAQRVRDFPAQTVAEDFSYYQQQVPGVYFYLLASPTDAGSTEPAPNHSPRFFVDERALPLRVRPLAELALDFLGPGRRGSAGS